MCKIVTDANKIRKLMDQSFAFTSEDSLEDKLNSLAKKEGIGLEYVEILFNNELDEEYQCYGELGDDKILFALYSPAVAEDCEAYLTFSQFYEYLENAVSNTLKGTYFGYNIEKRCTERRKYNKDKIINLLEKVKKGLGLSYC